CFSEQVGVKAPGTANSTALRPANSAPVRAGSMRPSAMVLISMSGSGWPIWMLMACSLKQWQPADASCNDLESPPAAPISVGRRQRAAIHAEEFPDEPEPSCDVGSA